MESDTTLLPRAQVDAASSVIGRWLFSGLATLGLGVGLFVSLWAGAWVVDRSVVIQAPMELVPGRPLPIRTLFQDDSGQAVQAACPMVSLRGSTGEVAELGRLRRLGAGFAGTCGAVLEVPQVARGSATLALVFPDGSSDGEAWRREVSVTVVRHRTPRAGTPLRNASKLALGDDSGPQPEQEKIDLRPMGRFVSSFENHFMVRVTDPAGAPLRRRVAVSLVSGHMGDLRGDEGNPPSVVEGETDASGLLAFSGLVETDVVRFRVEVTPSRELNAVARPGGEIGTPPQEGSAEAATPASRTVRLVSYPGASGMSMDTPVLSPGAQLGFSVQRLRPDRSMVVDVHRPDGTWAGFVVQPAGAPAQLDWSLPREGAAEGVWTLEAYHRFTEGQAGVATRSWLVQDPDADEAEVLRALLATAKEDLRGRAEAEDEETREARARDERWLEAIGRMVVPRGEEERRQLARWLIGTREIRQIGIPTALRSLPGDEADLAARRIEIHGWVRAWLIGGAAALLLGFGAWLLWETRRERARDEELAREEVEGVGPTNLQVLGRFAMMTTIVVGTLSLVIALFDNLIWSAG